MSPIIAFAALCAGLAGTLLGLAECGSSRPLVGSFEGFKNLPIRPGANPVIARQLNTVDLEVKPDGTAQLSDGGMAVSGHIEYRSEGPTFVPDAVLGVAAARQPPELIQKYTVVLKPSGAADWLYGGSVILKPKMRS